MTKTIINFDSSYRNKNPKNIIKSISYLNSNQLYFTKDSKIIKIFYENHNLKNQDRIVLQNVNGLIYNIKGQIEINQNSFYLKINHINHGLTDDITNFNNFKISISGVIGNTNNNNYLGNIPISLINTIHKVYLVSDLYTTKNNNYYFIKLDIKSNLTYQDNISDICIKYQNIFGVPLNVLNANYPLDNNQLKGYHIIENIIDNNNFTISTDFNAYETNNGGGSNMYIGLIEKSINAYPYANNYRITLNKPLYNVTNVNIIGAEFKNTDKLIKGSINPKTQNNKLYWEVLEDGSHIYNISILPGNYNISSLITEIQNRINETEVISYSDIIDFKFGLNNQSFIEKSKYFSSRVEINEFNSECKIFLFKKILLQNALFKSTRDSINDNNTRLTVYHKDHNLKIGDKIIISNASATDGIPSDTINNELVIDYIIDEESYDILLPFYNEDSSNLLINGGGNKIEILIPIKFRMFFDRSNTLGKILGFTRVGMSDSITPFDYSVANNKMYNNDFLYETTGDSIYFDSETQTIQNNSIILNNRNYLMLSCNFLNNVEDFEQNVQNTLCKILFGDQDSVEIDEYTQLIDVINNPIKIINEIEFSFFNGDGSLYNFHGIDHSFTLEFIEKNYEDFGKTK